MEQIKQEINNNRDSSLFNLNELSNLPADRKKITDYKLSLLNNYIALKPYLSPVNNSEQVSLMKEKKNGSFKLVSVPRSEIKNGLYGYIYTYKLIDQEGNEEGFFIGCNDGSENPDDVIILNLKKICLDGSLGCSGTFIHLVLFQNHIKLGSVKPLFYVKLGFQDRFKYITRYLYWDKTISVQGKHPQGLIAKEAIDNFTTMIQDSIGLPPPSAKKLSVVTFNERKPYLLTEQQHEVERMENLVEFVEKIKLSSPPPTPFDYTSKVKEVNYERALETARKYKEDHPEEVLEQSRQWRQTHDPNAARKRKVARIKELEILQNQQQLDAELLQEYEQLKQWQQSSNPNAARNKKVARIKELETLKNQQQLDPQQLQEYEQLQQWYEENKIQDVLFQNKRRLTN